MPKKNQVTTMDMDREHMVSEAAYFIAENRGFAEGNSEQDWYDAEKRIDKFLDEQTMLKRRKETKK